MISPARRCLAPTRGVLSARAHLFLRAGPSLLRRPWNEGLIRRFSADAVDPDGSPHAAPLPNLDRTPSSNFDGEPFLERNVLEVQKDVYHIGTVTVKSGVTDIKNLIDRIEPAPYVRSRFKSPTALLLVTPSFASALNSESKDAAPEAVGQAVSRLLKNSLGRASPLSNIRVVAAVVDRLPAPVNATETNKGFEGLAYALWYGDNVTSSSWTAQDSLEQDDTVGRLTFDIWDRYKLTDPEGKPRRDYLDRINRLHLPLANTVFQTGQTSIMWNILYSVSKTEALEDGTTTRFLRTAEINNVKYQRVTWPVSGRYLAHKKKDFPQQDKSLHQIQIPFVPLTAPRRVHAGMGNIIREIAGRDDKPAPASQELEQAVSSYFTATNQAPHPMPVWAMVFNEKAVKYFASAILAAMDKWQPPQFSHSYDYPGILSHFIEEAWKMDHKKLHSPIWKSLLLGNAKIHRVLSGGGGWGKKAGLISLDPRRSFEGSTKKASIDLPPLDSSSGVEALSEVAKPGSHIQFFASPVSSLEVPEYEPDTCVFGTIPSSIDDIPQTSDGLADIEAWPGWFGALSEQGMGMKYVVHFKSDGGGKEHYSQTMVDVPFSLFVTRNHLPGSPIRKPNAEVSWKNEPKLPSFNSENVIASSDLRQSKPYTWRSLRNHATGLAHRSPRRYFSTSPTQRLKSKVLARLHKRHERPMVPISHRLRELIDSPPVFIIPRLSPEDFHMPLSRYRHWWNVNRWLAERCEAERDARRVAKRRNATMISREMWERRMHACEARMVDLHDGYIRSLELHVRASGFLLSYWDSIIPLICRRVEKIGYLDKEMMPTNHPEWKKLKKEIAEEQRHVPPLPFKAPEVVEIFDQWVNKVRVKCTTMEQAIFKRVVRHRRRVSRKKEKERHGLTNLQIKRMKQAARLERQMMEPRFATVDVQGEIVEQEEVTKKASMDARLDPIKERKPTRGARDPPWRNVADLSTKDSISETNRDTSRGRPTVTYSSRPIPGSTYPIHNGRSQRRYMSTVGTTTPHPTLSNGEEVPGLVTTNITDAATTPLTINDDNDTPATAHPATADKNDQHPAPLLPPATNRPLDDDPWNIEGFNPYHHVLAPRARAAFEQKRRLRYYQLFLIDRSLRRLALAEIAYLDAAVRLSELVCVRLTQRCVAVDPRLFPLEPGLPDTRAGWDADGRRNAWLRPRVDEKTGERLGEESEKERLGEGTTYSIVRRKVGEQVVEAVEKGQAEDNRGLLMGTWSVEEEVEWLEAEIRRQRWRVQQLRKKAEVPEDEWLARRVGRFVDEEDSRGMDAFGRYRDRLVREVNEKLRTDTRGWRKKLLKRRLAEVRDAEMIYLEKVLQASDREFERAQEDVWEISEDITARRKKNLVNKEGGVKIGTTVRLVALRRGMDIVMEEKAAKAWALAKELEELLKR